MTPKPEDVEAVARKLRAYYLAARLPAGAIFLCT